MQDQNFLEKLFGLEGKVAVVLGGTSGIGRAIAIGYARAGATVVASSRRSDAVKETAIELEGLNAKTLALTSDVQSQESLVALCQAVVNEFGRVDVLVVSSGLFSKTPSVEMTEEDLVRVVDTNLNGTFRANQVFGRQMITQKRGAIVNIGSTAGHRTINEMAPYAASKAGVNSLTQTLASEWAPYQVRVNSIAPGPFKTPMNAEVRAVPGRTEKIVENIPMNRFGELPELVGAALFLGSDAASYVTGVTIPVDGGFIAAGF